MKWNDRLRVAFEAAKATRGIKQNELAKFCATSSASVSDWLSGETKNIEARFLIPACKFLRVSPFWVMMGDETQYEFDQVPDAAPVNASDIIRLIAAYSNTDDSGREKIVAAAEETKKLFPRS